MDLKKQRNGTLDWLVKQLQSSNFISKAGLEIAKNNKVKEVNSLFSNRTNPPCLRVANGL